MAEEATSHASVGAVLHDRLHDAVRRAGWATTGLVVLVGDPAVTEPAWDAVLDPVPGEWRRLWRPSGPGDLLAGLHGAEPPLAWTVVRVADLRGYLVPDDARLGTELAAALRGALRPETERPLLLVATMPADRETWRMLTHAPASGGDDRFAQARALLREAVVLTAHVPAAAPTPEPPASARPRAAAAPDGGAAAPAGVAPAAATASRAVAPSVPTVLSVPSDLSVPTVPSVSATSPGPQATGPGPKAASPVPPPGSDPAAVGPMAPGEPSDDPAPAAAAPTRPEPSSAPGATPPVVGEYPARERRPRPTDAERPVCARWRPSAVPAGGSAAEPAEWVRDRAVRLELAGNLDGARRLYEQAAHGGDVVALGRLAALREGGALRDAPDEEADRMFEAAAAEGNTAVLFGLAAAGHVGALRLLVRLREDAPPSA